MTTLGALETNLEASPHRSRPRDLSFWKYSWLLVMVIFFSKLQSKIISEHMKTKCNPVTDIYLMANGNGREGGYFESKRPL